MFFVTCLAQVLDERSVKCLFSKVWGFRDEGISSVVNALPNLGVDKVHVFRSIVAVVKRGLSDKIPQVYVSPFPEVLNAALIFMVLQLLFLASAASSIL